MQPFNLSNISMGRVAASTALRGMAAAQWLLCDPMCQLGCGLASWLLLTGSSAEPMSSLSFKTRGADSYLGSRWLRRLRNAPRLGLNNTTHRSHAMLAVYPRGGAMRPTFGPWPPPLGEESNATADV